MKTHAILVSLLMALGCTVARAQPEQIDRPWVDNVVMNTPPASEAAESGQPMLLPYGLSLEDLDEPTKEHYLELLRAHFDYHVFVYQHREKVFAWQHGSSQIIFAVVIILVFTAIYFSWLQFRQSLEPRRSKAPKEARQSAAATKGTEDVAAKDVGATQLEASVKGIKISSPILGVVILVISLLFFYLYLVHVYPIEEIF